jgi:hypothetical protein
MNLNLDHKKNKKGFAMLFSVLTASFLITIGMSIFNISLKELMISTSVRDSQTAYYASQSAYECFKYWQLFDTRGAFSPYNIDALGVATLKNGGSSMEIKCNGVSSMVELVRNDNGTYTYTSEDGGFFKYSSTTNSIEPEAGFSFVIEPIDNCSVDEVCVNKYVERSTSTFSGYNTSYSGRRVERKYEIIEANI